jgi:hypothetical protein
MNFQAVRLDGFFNAALDGAMLHDNYDRFAVFGDDDCALLSLVCSW